MTAQKDRGSDSQTQLIEPDPLILPSDRSIDRPAKMSIASCAELLAESATLLARVASADSQRVALHWTTLEENRIAAEEKEDLDEGMREVSQYIERTPRSDPDEMELQAALRSSPRKPKSSPRALASKAAAAMARASPLRSPFRSPRPLRAMTPGRASQPHSQAQPTASPASPMPSIQKRSLQRRNSFEKPKLNRAAC